MRSKYLLTMIFLTFSVIFSDVYSKKNLNFGFDGAAAITVGEDIKQLNAGFSLALDGVYLLSPNTQLGGRFSYTNWTPVRDAFLRSIENSSSVLDVDGSTWSMEIAPLFRVTTDFSDNIVNIFGQAGAGLYIISATTTVQYLDTLGLQSDLKLGEGTQARFGFSIGAGVTIGQASPVMFRMYPVWNFVARDQQPRRYWTFNGGIVVGL